MQIQVRNENTGVAKKLETMILTEAEASEEDTALLASTKEFLTQMLPEVSLIRTKLVQNMPQPEQAGGQGGAVGPAEAQVGPAAGAVREPPERKALRLGPQTIPKFYGSARTYLVHFRMKESIPSVLSWYSQ